MTRKRRSLNVAASSFSSSVLDDDDDNTEEPDDSIIIRRDCFLDARPFGFMVIVHPLNACDLFYSYLKAPTTPESLCNDHHHCCGKCCYYSPSYTEAITVYHTEATDGVIFITIT